MQRLSWHLALDFTLWGWAEGYLSLSLSRCFSQYPFVFCLWVLLCKLLCWFVLVSVFVRACMGLCLFVCCLYFFVCRWCCCWGCLLGRGVMLCRARHASEQRVNGHVSKFRGIVAEEYHRRVLEVPEEGNSRNAGVENPDKMKGT